MTANAGGAPKLVLGQEDVTVEMETGSRVLPLALLPERNIDWIEQGRRGMYDRLLAKEPPEFFSVHLPVVITQSSEGRFPFNCSNKGIGFIPREDRLGEFIELFQRTLDNTRGKPWQESMGERIEAMSKFYFDRDAVDYRAMTGLEIFEKQTYHNLKRTPLAALHFTGCAPEYMSFQLNCAVETVAADDPRHTFVLLARTMFEYDDFHIVQPQYPYAYIFWISEVVDKTPRQVQTAREVPVHGGMPWTPEASQAVERAPGMIQQFIREQVEEYAAGKGAVQIDLALVQEARRELEGGAGSKAPAEAAAEEESDVGQYGKIFAAVDGSEQSNAAMDLAIGIGERNGSELFGCHVYAAKLHDRRFRAMEGGLPEQYQEEKELERQRDVHDSLITQGLELITDSYLEQMSSRCREANLPFNGISLEGRNWQALVADIEDHDYDLITLGAFGVGRVSRSLLGTVAERVLRRVRRDVLLCKGEAQDGSGKIVVCLDGSTRSWGALMRGIQLARAFDRQLVAVSAFDPYFHYTMFNCLNNVLTDQAREVFKFEEQEKLHEDIIDSGLAKIYQSHLRIAEKVAADEGVELETHLLDGKAFDKILEFVQSTSPWLLVVGRIGIHSDEEMDIGGNTENLCRLAGCNVLVVDTQYKPSIEHQAEETVTWTKEARAKMEIVPPMAQGVAMRAVQNYCLAEGYTIVTGSVLNAAIRDILPPAAIERMGITFDDEERESQARIALSFKCPACGHVHRGARPQSCPICGREGREFKLAESAKVEDGVVLDAIGDRKLEWARDVLEELESIDDEVLRRQLRTQLEKRALSQRISTVTVEMLREMTGGQADEPVWTDEATKRLERVPDGFMRRAAQETVEEYARDNGFAEISLDVAEGGLGKAREKMAEAMRGGKAAAHGQRGRGPDSPPAGNGSFECNTCGLVTDGVEPARCLSCGASQFRGLTVEERRAAPSVATTVYEWDEDALERIGRIPPGFMRSMTSGRIEQWARKHGYERISLQVVEEKYASWGEGSEGLESELAWSAEALSRAQRIPEFIRPMVMREIERHVRETGDEGVDDEAISRFMESMSDVERFHHSE